jgi:hypothetical protein
MSTDNKDTRGMIKGPPWLALGCYITVDDGLEGIP